MISRIHEIIRTQDVLVLATTNTTTPLCSLMAYAYDTSITHIFMATPPSRKWKNLIHSSPKASLLVDTRTTVPPTERNAIEAVTIEATLLDQNPEHIQWGRQSLMERFPANHEFLNDESTRVLCFRLESYFYVTNQQDSVFIEL
ncbi:pyridoxamine 5'-phosphate oxidase family protein [Desulfovibrio inopinatus]|uniref:pyridoxamine 5'-phosphate oxidase family protein n=1 Tax=Desulfovibrio inopinatus TaxID=102109 RepID=UPI00041D7B0C|nr:pyridoxamine 5'-phosphate oxidase family protein [Desulfovibrio inopinatus]